MELINGNKLWQRSVFNNIKILYKAPKLSISNNKIFAIIGDNTVKAFNIKNGNILWQKKLATNITSIANNYNDLNNIILNVFKITFIPLITLITIGKLFL